MFDLQINLHLRFNFAPARLSFWNFTPSPRLARTEINLHQLLKEILLIFFSLSPLFYSQINSNKFSQMNQPV